MMRPYTISQNDFTDPQLVIFVIHLSDDATNAAELQQAVIEMQQWCTEQFGPRLSLNWPPAEQSGWYHYGRVFSFTGYRSAWATAFKMRWFV